MEKDTYETNDTQICNSYSDLGKAIKEGEPEIEITMDMKAKVIKIKAVGNVAWGVCAALLTVGVGAIIVTACTGGTTAAPAGVMQCVTTLPAAGILGSATLPAIGIMTGGGGIVTLNALRKKYKLKQKTDGRWMLVKS